MWRWGGLSEADLFDVPQGRAVYRVVNAALGVGHLLARGRPSLRHSLLARHLMIDALLARSGTGQVLELASGLSRRGAMVSSDPALSYTEVDRPHVIEAKRAILAGSDRGRAILARPNLRFVGADVTTMDLATVVEPARNAFVIAEGLLMYLKAPAQRDLWRRIAVHLSRGGGTLVFDLIPSSEQPPPGAVGRALGWLMRRSTGGHGLARDERGRADIASDLRQAGFASVEVIEPRDVADAWGLPPWSEPTQQVVFVGRVTAAS